MEIIKTLPIYDRYFSSSPIKRKESLNWKDLKSKKGDFETSLSKMEVDFSIRENSRCWQVMKKISVFILKVVIFPYGIHELIRYGVQRLIMLPLYPAQNRLVTFFVKDFQNKSLDQTRSAVAEDLDKRGYVVRHVVLEKNGTRYSGLLIGHKKTIMNGNWAINATGNCGFIEHIAKFCVFTFRSRSFNTLLVNGPSLGRSQGEATNKSMGEAQEAGISFLEHAVKAKNIVMVGHSLGGAAMGQAILRHKFRPSISYLVIQQMTFDSVSHICGEIVGVVLKPLVKVLVKWAGCEMNTALASKKLQKLGIREVVVQATRDFDSRYLPLTSDFIYDGVIPARASLGYRLIEQKVIANKNFFSFIHGKHDQVGAEGCPPLEFAVIATSQIKSDLRRSLAILKYLFAYTLGI
jgi:hypothetical protein